MAYQAKVVKVFIASPGDVSEERQVVRDVIAEWNVLNSELSKIVLLPVGWETHSSPEMGDRPQAIVNKQVLKDCDLLVAVFWTRLGTPTGQSASGTVEEIKEHLKLNKPTMIYFSQQRVRPDDIDPDQYDVLKKFKDSCMTKGLIQSYKEIEDFRRHFTRHLSRAVSDWKSQLQAFNATKDVVLEGDAELNVIANKMLVSVAKSRNGMMYFMQSRLMFEVISDDVILKTNDPRERASWEHAASFLCAKGLLEKRPNSDLDIFKLTHAGYTAADRLVSAPIGGSR
ncbi:MAG: DUF4062 domain-containing protein [Phycisphaeraceae bacterium]|nr:DUF4062 domain-containing protein [Phycisphaerales bacterium]MCB9860381.1 DUF4062 domain-containing protein [Phycisphaeraceae bacterium]